MPTNQELAVILKLKDELTGALNRAVQAAGKELDDLGHRMKTFGREVSQFGRNLAFLGASITGAFSVSLAVAQRYSIGVSNALRDLNAQQIRLQLIIAQALVPVLNTLTALLSKVVDAFQKMNPATRDAILQWTAIGGVLLIATGLITHVYGSLIKLVGQILIWAGSITVAHGGIVLLIAVIGAVVIATVGWEKALIGLARAVDVAAQAVKFLVNLLESGLFRVMAFGLGVWEKWLRLLERLDGPMGKVAPQLRQAAEEARRMRQELDKTSMDFAGGAVRDLDALVKTFKEGGGTTEEFARHLQDLIDKLKNVQPAGAGMIAFVQSFKAQWTQTLKEALDFGKTFADATIGFFRNLESGVARSVENVILHGGKFKNFLKDLGRSIVQSFVSMVSQLIAHILVWLPILLLLNAIPGGTFILKALDLSSSFIGPTISAAKQVKHQGGLIQRFQHGGEVMAMLEPGEFVVNRRATQQNRELLEDVNSGRGTRQPAGQNLAVVFNVNAIDPRSGTEFLLRNSKTIADAVGQEILRNNQPFRRVSRRFA